MADGRAFTDYRPRCDTQLELASAMSGSQGYRQHLQQNGEAIMEASRKAAAQASFCGPCSAAGLVPESDRVVCDKVSCARVAVQGADQAFGIGTGRAY
jgi:hypothetical protein